MLSSYTTSTCFLFCFVAFFAFFKKSIYILLFFAFILQAFMIYYFQIREKFFTIRFNKEEAYVENGRCRNERRRG